MTSQEKLAQAAASFIGAPFRLHGRDPQTGLDCMGLLIASLEAIGIRSDRPTGYALRNSSIDAWRAYAERWSLKETTDDVRAGDVLLISPGPRQHHLQIAENRSTVIHAHAGLRRVVRGKLSNDLSLEAHLRIVD